MLITKEQRQSLVHQVRKATSGEVAEYRHIVICGPSGSGKSTLIRNHPQSILRCKPHIYDFSISCTTRDLRKNEVDGFDYRKLTIADFGMTDFFESNEYTGNKRLYGTPVSEIERIALYQKKRCAFDVDPNGAIAIKEEFGDDVLTVFLNTTPSKLKERLLKRGGMTTEEIEKRLMTAEKEGSMVESGKFIPDIILPYDDVRVGEAANMILLNARVNVIA